MNVYTYQTELANNGIFGAYNYPRDLLDQETRRLWVMDIAVHVGHMYLLMLKVGHKRTSAACPRSLLWTHVYGFHQNGEHLSTTTVAYCFNLVYPMSKLPSTHSRLSYSFFLVYTGYIQLCDANRKSLCKHLRILLKYCRSMFIKPGALNKTRNINFYKPCIYFCCGVFL